MKRILRNLLRRAGYEIKKIEARAPAVQFPAEEREEVERILREFAEAQPAGALFGDRAALRRYLSDHRMEFFHDLLDHCEELKVSFGGKRIADVGTGMGYLLRLVGKRAPDAELRGFDTLSEALSLAEKLCPKASFEVAKLGDLSGQYDFVFCTEVLEHLISPRLALRQLWDLVAPAGALVITVPNGRTDCEAAGQMREDGTAYWGHIHFWSPEGWALFLSETLGPEAKIETGNLQTGENYAVAARPAS